MAGASETLAKSSDDWKPRAAELIKALLPRAHQEAKQSLQEFPGLKGDALAMAVGKQAITQMAFEIHRLQQRIDKLEASGIKYCGTWQRAMHYARGDVVTHAGSAWVALTEASSEPGDGATWQLMVKRGRDGT